MRLHLKIWRQPDAESSGGFVDYTLENISADVSFLEMLDALNEQCIAAGEDAIAFDHDCREGICGACSLTINGEPHGPQEATTACQLHLRHFKDGQTITIEPFRARSFPVLKDLICDRSALDTIIQAGGFNETKVGSAPEANTMPIAKPTAETAMDAAACIGCGACVAACPNGSAMLFAGAKITHLNTLPQGKIRARARTAGVVNAMDAIGFGNCSNTGECSARCPKSIDLSVIAKLNRDFAAARIRQALGQKL